jgi:hypothetical protein
MKHSILSLLVLACLSACSANLPQIAQTAGDALGRNDQAQMVRAIKETLVPPTDYRYPHMG